MTYRTPSAPPHAVVTLGPLEAPSAMGLAFAVALGLGAAAVLVRAGSALLFAILAMGWLAVMGSLLGKRTVVRIIVRPDFLEVETRWGGLIRRASRTLPRPDDEMARVVMAERGRRGHPPTWRIEYGGGTNDYTPLLDVSALQKPIALEHAAARTRAALAQVPRRS